MIRLPPGALRRAACLLGLLALTAPASAAPPDARLKPLALQAELIAFGTCESTQTGWDAEHRWIVTTLKFRPRRSFKGQPGSNLTIKVLGGQIGSEGMIASHSAAMSPGEDAVLFLTQSRFGDYYVITGGADGKLSVRVDPVSAQPLIRGALSLDDFDRWIGELTRAQ